MSFAHHRREGAGLATVNAPRGLVLVEDIAYRPMYHLNGWPGATTRLYLHAQAHARLREAEKALRRLGPRGSDLRLLVLDGHRPAAVQQGLFDEYADRLLADLGGDAAQAQAGARQFVSDPAGTYPHGTGGAVDLTVTADGEPAWMGTAFDDFTEQSARRWYRDHPPRTARDREAAANRELLFAAMDAAGFVGHPAEWWHFEYGTERWARGRGVPPVLTEVLHPPA